MWPPLLNEKEIFAEWRIFKRALAKEKRTKMKKRMMSKPPTLLEVKRGTELTNPYRGIVPQIFSLSLPVVTVIDSGPHDIMKTRLHNRLSVINLTTLLRIVFEGPELTSVN